MYAETATEGLVGKCSTFQEDHINLIIIWTTKWKDKALTSKMQISDPG